jgi:enoyl-CoA hydratase
VPENSVLFEVQENIGIMTLNRADNRNSMTPDLLAGVAETARSINAREDVRCLIIRGSGNTFCGGADFRGDAEETDRYGHEKLHDTYKNFLSILDIEVPVIACMNGHAIGGGLGLALVCDIRVANKDARYGANFVKLGMHPGMATTYFFPRFMGVPRAMELLLTGRVIKGDKAAEFGLVNYAVDVDEVFEKSLELAREIASAAPLAVRWTKRSAYDNLNWDIDRAAGREAQLQSQSMKTKDFREGVKALLEKRSPEFKGQ